MMNRFPDRKLLLIAAIATILAAMTGCHTQPTKTVTVTEYVMVVPEKKYLTPTPVPAAEKLPPVDLTEVNWEKEFFRQVDQNVTLYGALGSCNADKLGATRDITEKRKKYESK